LGRPVPGKYNSSFQLTEMRVSAVADRWAFVVAIDKFLNPGLGTVPYAEAGAKAVADSLAAAGYPRQNQFVLTGQHATRAVVESRLRKLKKAVRRGDTVLAYVAGRGFARAGAGFLACWDTLPDDLTETSLPLADLVAVSSPKVGQAVFLFDVGAGPRPANVQPADIVPHLDQDGLGTLFEDSDNAACLTATQGDEESHAAAALKGSVWTYLLIAARAGRAAKAADREGRVTARSLQKFIEAEAPRVLRKHFEAGVEQTPQLFGGATAVVADLSHVLGAADGGSLLDPERLRRVLFRSESLGRVKDLTHWRKTFDVPTDARPSAKRFVARIATADVQADLDAVFEAARERLGYRRKDLDVGTGPDGVGTVRTPDFEYTVTAALDPDDATRVLWRREVGQFTDPAFPRGPGLEAVFGKLFDQLVFEFASAVDVAALVDRLEDRPPKGAKVQVASDGRSCDITLAGFAGRVTVDRHALTIRGRAGNAAGLLDQFLTFLRTVGPLGEQPMLPAAH
jgi:hypothetical protein